MPAGNPMAYLNPGLQAPPGMDPGLWAAIQAYSGGGAFQPPGGGGLGGGVPSFSLGLPGGGSPAFSTQLPGGGGPRAFIPPGVQAPAPGTSPLPPMSAQTGGQGVPQAMLPPQGVSTQPQGQPQLVPGQRGYQDPGRGQAPFYRAFSPEGAMPGATVSGRSMAQPSYASGLQDRLAAQRSGRVSRPGAPIQPKQVPVPQPPPGGGGQTAPGGRGMQPAPGAAPFNPAGGGQGPSDEILAGRRGGPAPGAGPFFPGGEKRARQAQRTKPPQGTSTPPFNPQDSYNKMLSSAIRR